MKKFKTKIGLISLFGFISAIVSITLMFFIRFELALIFLLLSIIVILSTAILHFIATEKESEINNKRKL